jgi:hypothetical protein
MGQEISSISPNNNDGSYNIVTDGLLGSPEAHTDESFIWQNIPPELLGADYVQTYNGDNSNSSLTIDVTINQPATLYVFHSDQVEDPSWLTSAFTDTTWTITRSDGVDYSVFSMELNGTGSNVVTLQDNDPQTTNSEQMYGVAAIPEPTSLALIGLGGLALLRRRRA